jgi:hypothetical protein
VAVVQDGGGFGGLVGVDWPVAGDVVLSGVPPQVSAVRLAVASRAMALASTVQAVIEAKNKAKAAGLTPRDLPQLKLSFETHVARVRAMQMKEQEHAGR